MIIDGQAFSLDDVDEVTQNLLEKSEERVVGHDAEYSLGDPDFQIAHIVHGFFNRPVGRFVRK